jgi:hypothetical protein
LKPLTRLKLIKKAELTVIQAEHLQLRLELEMHRDDGGPVKCWNIYSSGLFAFIELDSGLPIAIAEASGNDCVRPGWWIDSDFRNKKYGYELVDLLAEYLKAQGVRQVGPILIQTLQGSYDTRSTKLALRFRSHFSS